MDPNDDNSDANIHHRCLMMSGGDPAAALMDTSTDAAVAADFDDEADMTMMDVETMNFTTTSSNNSDESPEKISQFSTRRSSGDDAGDDPEDTTSASGMMDENEQMPLSDFDTIVNAAAETQQQQLSREQEERRKIRAKLKRMLLPGAKPSFLALISEDHHLSDDDGGEMEFRIDVDEYLGLKPKREQSPGPIADQGERKRSATSHVTLPADEGWYEGVRPMTLPGEERYLNELHRYIRSHLEFFSATPEDLAIPLPGRRTPTVLGKVGIRCSHCAKAAREATPESPAFKIWPSASISYPLNIAGIYSICAQKSTHFENCPNFPPELKAELYLLTQEHPGSSKRQRRGTIGDARHVVTISMYYIISAKQLGIVEVKDGLRFGRDLTLEPLPMETIRAQLEDDPATAYGRAAMSSPQRPDSVSSSEPRITADEDSERILAAAVAEKDDETRFLARSQDKNLLTDFMFLCVRQMAICHADEADFETRGKKTKSMRVGFTGFCCRHCAAVQDADNPLYRTTNFICRSFSSAADNLASAISNSFYAHLEKCSNVPVELKQAMVAYKKIHARQMRQLPSGSQRRLFHLLWSRMRSTDLTAEEIAERQKKYSHLPSAAPDQSQDNVTEESAQPGSPRPDPVSSLSAVDWSSTWTRPSDFPVSDDEETQRVLEEAEKEAESSEPEALLLPSDRTLISDYVFLIMKQLRVAYPTSLDFARGRRSTVLSMSQPGMRCKYCMHEDPRYTTTGRSFPSQADNIASTLNSSLYHHMQKCHLVPDEMKRALVNLKKIHSSQIAALRFGAQRRFFHILFDRLTDLKLGTDEDESGDATAGLVSDGLLQKLGFIRTVGAFCECQHCRVVPLSLRARDSLAFESPTIDFVNGHRELCAQDSFDLSLAADVLSGAFDACPAILQDGSMSEAFKTVVSEAVCAEEQLSRVFTDEIVRLLPTMNNPEEKRRVVAELMPKSKGLWTRFPVTVDAGKVMRAFETFASTIPGLSPNLFDNKEIIRYLHVISPSLMIFQPHQSTGYPAESGDSPAILPPEE